MLTRSFALSNDPIGDLFIATDEMDLPCEITEEQARALGCTDEEIDLARRGYGVACETIAVDTLDAIIGWED